MKPIVIIPARGGSKGIPGKNIMPFCGLPLIAWSIRQSKEAGFIPYVTTDDEDIARCAVAFGALLISRPKTLATDDTKMVDVLQHAIKCVSDDFDTVILLQPTSPLRERHDIKKALELYERRFSKYLFCGHDEKLIEHIDGRSFVNENRQKIDPRLIEHGMIYIYDDCYKPLGLGSLSPEQISVYRTSRWQSFEIDEPDDVEITEFYMRRKILCTQ